MNYIKLPSRGRPGTRPYPLFLIAEGRPWPQEAGGFGAGTAAGRLDRLREGSNKEDTMDKLVCLEKRPGKAPRVRLVGTDDESILKVSGPNYSFKAFKTRDGVDVCRVMPEDGQNVEFENDAGTILYTNLTEQQVQELLNEWGNQQ